MDLVYFEPKSSNISSIFWLNFQTFRISFKKSNIYDHNLKHVPFYRVQSSHLNKGWTDFIPKEKKSIFSLSHILEKLQVGSDLNRFIQQYQFVWTATINYITCHSVHSKYLTQLLCHCFSFAESISIIPKKCTLCQKKIKRIKKKALRKIP